MNNTKTELVNVANDGSKGNNYAENSVISANGRYVVFESDADNLVANDTNFAKDIFVRDLVTGTTQRISVNSEGSEGNNNSANPVISADGRYVAFESDADNLIAKDTNFAQDIFVRDLVNGTTQRVNLANDGSQIGLSLEPSISAGGRYVAFTSYARNLVSGDSNNTADVFVRDLVNNTTQRVSIANGGFESNNYSQNPSISADGRYVAFQSLADNLVPGDINDFIDIFVRDLVNGTTKLVSISQDGSPSLISPSLNPNISADGRYVVFESVADNLVADDTNFAKDIFVRDLVNETTEIVSVNSNGSQANKSSSNENPSISADGRYITFLSDANNLVATDTNSAKDVFVRDLVDSTTERVNLTSDGSQTSSLTDSPSISHGGRYIAFQSAANDFIANDTDDSQDIFVRDRGDSFADPDISDIVFFAPNTPDVIVPTSETSQTPDVVVPTAEDDNSVPDRSVNSSEDDDSIVLMQILICQIVLQKKELVSMSMEQVLTKEQLSLVSKI